MANMAFILKSPRLVLILMFCSSVHVIPLKMEHAMFNNVTVIFFVGSSSFVDHVSVFLC